MTSVTLYEIADARDILDNWLVESGGELTPEIEQLLNELDGAANEKIERVALYIREQKSLADAAKQERDRLAGIAAARLKAAESLTGYLHREMDRLGKDKVNGVLVSIALQKNPPSVVGEPVRPLEGLYIDKPEFVRYSPASFALDRKAVIEAHKAGQQIPEGLSVAQTVSVRIR
jgi:hypothetical protein